MQRPGKAPEKEVGAVSGRVGSLVGSPKVPNRPLDAGLQRLPISLLTAFPKTPLHSRLEEEGRLTEIYDNDMLSFKTNIVPKQMDYQVRMRRYRELHRRLYTEENIAERVRMRTRILDVPTAPSSYSAVEQAKILGRLLYRGILQGGPRRWYHFLRSIPFSDPKLIPDALLDWSVAIQVQDFTRRNHVRASEFDKNRTEELAADVRCAFQKEIDRGALAIAGETESLTGGFRFTIRGKLGNSLFGFYTRMPRYLNLMLNEAIAPITFRVEQIPPEEVEALNALLKKFPLHCDRFYVDIDESLQGNVRIDAVKVNLVLHPRQERLAPRSSHAA